MTKRERRFWKYQFQCKPEEFAERCSPKCALNGYFLTDEQLGYLSPYMKGVEELNLTATEITDEGVAYLTALPRLSYLRLKDTNITAACIPHLLQIKELKQLHVGHIKATCRELQPLVQLEKLAELIAGPIDYDEELLYQMLTQRPSLDLIINGKKLYQNPWQ